VEERSRQHRECRKEEARTRDGQVTDATVLAKSAAAEEWATLATDSKLFGVWRYLLVSESDIRSAPNWEALVAA
jgi:type III restriction enzyme